MSVKNWNFYPMTTSDLDSLSLETRIQRNNNGNRGFPKVDHSGIDARIVLEQNKFTKKATSNRT